MPGKSLGVVAIALYVAASPGSSASASGPGDPGGQDRRPENVVRVRAPEAWASRLLALGLRRSPTFRREVETLERGDLIVWIRTELDLGVRGQLQFVARRSSWRLAHIAIRAPAADYDAVSVLAHELWHAIEILHAPGVGDQPDLVALECRIGEPTEARGYETAAAVRVERQVLDEMYAAGRLAKAVSQAAVR